MYFSVVTTKAVGVYQRSINAVGVAEYACQAIPSVIGAARYGGSPKEYADHCLCGLKAPNSVSYRGVIGPVSQRVGEVWRCRSLVELMARDEGGANMLLLFRRREEIEWDATFRGLDITGFGRWLPYDYCTGTVGEPDLLSPRFKGEVLTYPGFRVVSKVENHDTLASCQAEITAQLALRQGDVGRRSFISPLAADDGFVDTVPAQVFRTFSRMVPRTEVELVYALSATIQAEDCLHGEHNNLIVDLDRYRGELDLLQL